MRGATQIRKLNSSPKGLFQRLFVRCHSNEQKAVEASTSAKAVNPRILGAGTNIFDRILKRTQRNRAATNFQHYDFLRSEISYRLADRIYDIKRFFPMAVDFGCGQGLLAPHIFKENVGIFVQLDLSDKMIEMAKVSEEVPTFSMVADEEMAALMFRPSSIDLAISCLSMHWINDLPAFFQRIHSALKPDGVFVAAMFGGQTLYQLRCSLQLAEMERLGGVAAHISPFTDVSDIGSLMNRAGFKMLTVDVDNVEVKYSNIYKLMYDLKGMSENSCSHKRAKYIRRDVLDAASAIYQEMYSDESGFLLATFQVIYLIGWREGPTTPKPAKRGSAHVSMKELGKVAH